MRTRIFFIIFAIILSLFLIRHDDSFAEPVKTPAQETIVIAVDPTWPPMEFIDAVTHEPVGFDIDLIKAIAAAEGFRIRIVPMAWDGIFHALQAGKVDAICSSVTVTDERKAAFSFTGNYLNTGQVAVMRKDFPGSHNDVPASRRGAVIATSGAKVAAGEDNKEISGFSLDEEMMKALIDGKIDAAYIDLPLAVRYCTMIEGFKGKLEIRSDVLMDEFVAIAFRKKDTALGDKLNAGLAKIRADGTYGKIVQKWLHPAKK